jgi:hypothetical protein
MSIFKKTTVGAALLVATALLGGCYVGPAYGPRYGYRPASAYGPAYAPAPVYGYYGGGYRRW